MLDWSDKPDVGCSLVRFGEPPWRLELNAKRFSPEGRFLGVFVQAAASSRALSALLGC